MAVLIVFAAALAACYSPDVRDCLLACASADDCATGQTCTVEHLCAAAVSDCSTDARPSEPVDAHEPTVADAAAFVPLHVHIMGPGTVTLAPCTATCTCTSDCMLDAIANTTSSLVAIPQPGQQFDSWTGAPCMGQPATCVFAPAPMTQLDVKFVKAN